MTCGSSLALSFETHLLPTWSGLQVALLGVVARYRVQASVLVQPLGAVGFIVDVVSDLLQILEVGPEKQMQESQPMSDRRNEWSPNLL